MDELFRRHWPAAHRAAYLVVHDSAAAEDVAQEAFLAAVRSLDRFDRRRPFGPWLHRIVVNRAIDFARAGGAPGGGGRGAGRAGVAVGRRRRGALGRRARGAGGARAGAARGDRDAPPARVHAGRDRGGARVAARDGELAAAARARRAARAPGGGGRAVSDHSEVRARLSEVDVPDGAAARERAWAAVDEAFLVRRPARRGRLPGLARRPAVALAFVLAFAMAVAVAAASTPPGATVRSFVARVLGGEATPAPRARTGPLPAGRMLVTSQGGGRVV